MRLSLKVRIIMIDDCPTFVYMHTLRDRKLLLKLAIITSLGAEIIAREDELMVTKGINDVENNE